MTATHPPHPAAVDRPRRDLTAARNRLAPLRARSTHLAAAHQLIVEALAALDTTWADCLADIAGQPGSGLGGGGGHSGGDHGDPTARGATDPDRGAADRATIEATARRLAGRSRAAHHDHSTHLARSIHDDADTLRKIVSKRTPRPALDHDRRIAADGEPGCESCWRIKWWSPIYRPWRQGTLGKTVSLCRPCYERAIADGVLPSVEDVEHKRDHGKWRRRHEPRTVVA